MELTPAKLAKAISTTQTLQTQNARLVLSTTAITADGISTRISMNALNAQ